MRTPSPLTAVAILALWIVGCAPPGGEPAPPVAEEQSAPELVEELECFDADYPIEPTFDTPEEALEHAVRTEGDAVPAPEDIDEYERIERGDGWVDFAFGAGEQVHHTWGITRDEDGRWGLTSLGGCVPA